eukprot:7628738-Pyramimonas_sp.AAC.1
MHSCRLQQAMKRRRSAWDRAEQESATPYPTRASARRAAPSSGAAQRGHDGRERPASEHRGH